MNLNDRWVRGVSTWGFLCCVMATGSAAAQDVYYQGKLQIGYGDGDNVAGFRQEQAVPICAGGGPVLNPATVGTTLGTLLFNGRGQGAPGVGGALTFHAVSPANGGAQEKRTQTCRKSIPGFANPRFRSRTTAASAHFPGRRGAFTPNLLSAPVPATPTATYMLSAGGGNEQSISVNTWTTRATAAASVMTYTGFAFEGALTRIQQGVQSPTVGVHRVQPGPARFGGGVPYSGRDDQRIGIVFSSPPSHIPIDFGLLQYAQGTVPFGPRLIGTDATGHTPPLSPSNSLPTYTRGLLYNSTGLTYAIRTPGGSTKDQQGAIRTLAGGNTATPAPGCPDAAGAPCIDIITPVIRRGINYEWTTGAVTHTNMYGDFTTIQRASGYDIAVAPSTAVAGETRRIQVVSPWSASVEPVGPFGFPVRDTHVGGVAVLTLNVIPYEPDLDMSDGDLVLDNVDNCTTVANGPAQQSNQIDTDQDGYGNACDADYNNDGFTTTIDYTFFLTDFLSGARNAQTDHNGDGFTTTLDFPFYLNAFTGAASLGPSGLACAGGPPPCLP